MIFKGGKRCVHEDVGYEVVNLEWLLADGGHAAVTQVEHP
jgi:hypothetical protein